MAHPELKGLSDWTVFNSKNVYTNKKFQIILDFYLFECPNQHMSVRSHSFGKHGWTRTSLTHLQRLLTKASDPEIKFHRVAVKEFFAALSRTNQLGAVDCTHEVAIYGNNDSSLVTLFGAIRNAFAHGSYQVKTVNGVRYYCMENRKCSSGSQTHYFDREVRARIILKEDTLIRWVDIVRGGITKV